MEAKGVTPIPPATKISTSYQKISCNTRSKGINAMLYILRLFSEDWTVQLTVVVFLLP